MLERGPVAGNDDRRAAAIVFELRRLGGLVLASFLVSFFEQRRQRESFLGQQRVAGQETHLIDQAHDPLDAVGQSDIERGAEFGVFPFIGQQLLVRGERDHGIADFMGEPIGHGFDQAQIGGLNLEAAQLFALGAVFDHQQGGSGQAGLLPLERDDIDVVNGAR